MARTQVRLLDPLSHLANTPVPVIFQGAPAILGVLPNRSELERRRISGGVLSTDMAKLDTLLQIPTNVYVPQESLSPREWAYVAGLGPGLIDRYSKESGFCLRRLAVPAARVTGAFITGKNWRKALSSATQFAQYCQRSIIIPDRPRDEDLMLMEAAYYGVGVFLGRVRSAEGSGAEIEQTILEPEPFVPARFTGASWQFAELAQNAASKRDLG